MEKFYVVDVVEKTRVRIAINAANTKEAEAKVYEAYLNGSIDMAFGDIDVRTEVCREDVADDYAKSAAHIDLIEQEACGYEK